MACLSGLTGELIRHSDAEQLIKATLIESVGPGADLVLFSADPGDDITPPGILNGIAPLPPAPASDDAWKKDLGAIMGAVARAVGGEIVVIVAPEQWAALPAAERAGVLRSNALLAGSIVAVGVDALAVAIEGPPRIQASQQAITHESDTPGEIADIGGILATPVRSYFQTDGVSLRLIWPVDWALRSPGAVAHMEAVTW